MDNELLNVADNLVVSLEYSLRLEDGTLIDRSESGEPLEFLQGLGQIIPGLEKELYGMGVGDEKEVVVAPADAYGPHDPEEMIEFPRTSFPPSLELNVGEALMMQNTQTGETFKAYVAAVQPETVTLDFNHPLAGKTLYFHVKIAGLRQASQEELAHGHVHAPGQAQE